MEESKESPTLAAIAGAYSASASHYEITTTFDVCRRLSRIAIPITRPDSPLVRMWDAVRLYVEIKDVKYEESSHRYIVSFIVVGSETGEVESIRTDRVDGRYGKMVEEMLGNDKAALTGKKAVIYKVNEEMRGAPGRTVRITPFIDVLD